MTTFGTTSCFLNIEYLQGSRVPIKLTKLFPSARDFTVQVEFTRGRYPGTKWKFHSDDFRSTTWMNQQFSDLISQSNNVELSTVFVSPACITQERLQEGDAMDILMESLNPDVHVIQTLPREPDFEIVFAIQRTDEELPPLVTLFQPENGTADHGALQNQIQHLQEQLEQNRHETAQLREQLRRQGGVDVQNQLNRLEILINETREEQRAALETADARNTLIETDVRNLQQHFGETRDRLQAVRARRHQDVEHYNGKLEALEATVDRKLFRMETAHKQREQDLQTQIRNLQSKIPPVEEVVTLSEPLLIGSTKKQEQTLNIKFDVVPREAKKVRLLVNTSGSVGDGRISVYTTVGSVKYYHHLTKRHVVEWEFPIAAKDRTLHVEWHLGLFGRVFKTKVERILPYVNVLVVGYVL